MHLIGVRDVGISHTKYAVAIWEGTIINFVQHEPHFWAVSAAIA